MNISEKYSHDVAYKLYFTTVFISSDALKFIKESEYLGFTFSDSKSDYCDM